MLCIAVLSVIMFCQYVECYYAGLCVECRNFEGHYSVCHYAERLGAIPKDKLSSFFQTCILGQSFKQGIITEGEVSVQLTCLY